MTRRIDNSIFDNKNLIKESTSSFQENQSGYLETDLQNQAPIVISPASKGSILPPELLKKFSETQKSVSMRRNTVDTQKTLGGALHAFQKRNLKIATRM